VVFQYSFPVVFLALFLALQACGAAKRPAEKAPVANPQPTPSDSQPPQLPPTPLSRPEERLFDESVLRGREFLFQQKPFSAIPAQDFDLGPLDFGEDPVVALARQFADQLESRGFDEALVNPRWSLYLRGRLGELKELGWAGSKRRWSVKKSPQEGEALVEVFMRQGTKNSRALIYLGEVKGLWKVNDLQQFELQEAKAFDPLPRSPGLLP
jgi:hypothetical protein